MPEHWRTSFDGEVLVGPHQLHEEREDDPHDDQVPGVREQEREDHGEGVEDDGSCPPRVNEQQSHLNLHFSARRGCQMQAMCRASSTIRGLFILWMRR